MKFCHAACKGSSVNQKQSLLFQKFMTENAYSQMLNVASIFVAQVLLTLTFVGKLPKHYWVFSLVKEFLKCYCFVINLPPFAFPLESTTNGNIILEHSDFICPVAKNLRNLKKKIIVVERCQQPCLPIT